MGRSDGLTSLSHFSLVVPSVIACSQCFFLFLFPAFWPKKEKRQKTQKKSSSRGEVNGMVPALRLLILNLAGQEKLTNKEQAHT